MSSSAQKLSGWRLSTSNALPKLQAKAIEAQAGLLSPAEAALLVASVQAIYQKLYDITSGEEFRIYSLPAAEQAHAFQHWGVLMQEPLRTQALLKVIESSLRAVVAPVEPIQIQHIPHANQASVQLNAPHPRPPSHVSTAISYHTVLDFAQPSDANQFSPPFEDYRLSVDNPQVGQVNHRSQEAAKTPPPIPAWNNPNTVPPPPGFPPMAFAHIYVGQNGYLPNFSPMMLANNQIAPPQAPAQDYANIMAPPPGFHPMSFTQSQLGHNMPPHIGNRTVNQASFDQVHVTQQQHHTLSDRISPDLHQNDLARTVPRLEQTKLESKLPRIELPKFDGRKDKFPEFIQAFKDRIDSRKDITNLDKLYCLVQYLSGEAKAAIEGYAMIEDNYLKCLSLLQREFGCDSDIAYQIRASLDSIQPPRDTIQCLTDFVNKVCAQFRRLEGMSVSCDEHYIVRRIVDKLPLSWREKWSTESKYGLTASFQDFQPFLRNRLQEVRRNNLTDMTSESSTKFSKKSFQQFSPTKQKSSNPESYSADRNRDSTPSSCIFCDQSGHRPTRCPTVVTREERLRALGPRCRNCFEEGHWTRQCTSSRNCFKCDGRHHVAICPVSSSNHSLIAASHTHGLTAATKPIENGIRALLTTTVKAKAKSNNAFTDAVVVFDTGATRSYVTASFASRMNLKTVATVPLLIHGFAGNVHAEQSRLVSFEIQTSNGLKEIVANTIKTIADGPVEVPGTDSVAPQNIDILFGLDYVFDLISVPTIVANGETRIQTSIGNVLLLSNKNIPTSNHSLFAFDGMLNDKLDRRSTSSSPSYSKAKPRVRKKKIRKGERDKTESSFFDSPKDTVPFRDKNVPRSPEPIATVFDERITVHSVPDSPKDTVSFEIPNLDIDRFNLFDFFGSPTYQKDTSTVNTGDFSAKTWLFKIKRTFPTVVNSEREDLRFLTLSMLLPDEQTRHSFMLKSDNNVTYSAGYYQARGNKPSVPPDPTNLTPAPPLHTHVHAFTTADHDCTTTQTQTKETHREETLHFHSVSTLSDCAQATASRSPFTLLRYVVFTPTLHAPISSALVWCPLTTASRSDGGSHPKLTGITTPRLLIDRHRSSDLNYRNLFRPDERKDITLYAVRTTATDAENVSETPSTPPALRAGKVSPSRRFVESCCNPSSHDAVPALISNEDFKTCPADFQHPFNRRCLPLGPGNVATGELSTVTTPRTSILSC